MTILRTILLSSVCLLLVSGCYEDEAVITLNIDGSGTLSQTLTLSERLLVAASDGNAPDSVPPVSEEHIREQIGSALTITAMRETDLPDGGKRIEFSGTFEQPEQFFLSEFARETLNLRLAPAGAGHAAIHHSMEFDSSTSAGPSLTQLYGLAKGMYVRRSIRVPAPIDRTNGRLGDDKQTVHWVMDLRDQQGLEKTKAFVEGPDKGKGIAVFDASALTFSLPLEMEAPASPVIEEDPDPAAIDDTAFEAEVVWASRVKKRTADGQIETSDMEIGVELRWSEEKQPKRCGPVVLLSAMDDRHKDLLADARLRDFQTQISAYDQQHRKKELTQRLAVPSENAQALKDIRGYLEVVADTQTQTITLDNIQSLIGAESTGNNILDDLNFKIKGISQSSMTIDIEGGVNTLISIEAIIEDGGIIKQQGYGGWGNSYSYDFAKDVTGVQQCRLEVVTGETIVKVPFTLDEILLP